jgi:hypothetical protein
MNKRRALLILALLPLLALGTWEGVRRVPAGVVAWYTFDHQDARDVSGNGNTGTLNGGISVASGVVTFDGTGDFVQMSSGYGFSETFSIVGDINTPRDKTQFLVVLHDSANNGTGLRLYTDTAGRILFNSDTFPPYITTINAMSSLGAVPQNTWTQIVVTYSAGSTKLYANAVEVGSSVLSGLDPDLGWIILAKLNDCLMHNFSNPPLEPSILDCGPTAWIGSGVEKEL